MWKKGKKAGLPVSLYGDKVTLEDFEHVKMLGRGGFGKVFLVRFKDTGELFALKCLKKANISKEESMIEKNVLQIAERTNNTFLVGMKYVFQNDSHVFFVIRYVAGGSLNEIIKKQPG